MPLLLLLLVVLAGCGSPRSPERTLTVFNAGSLARPMRAVLDTFARREGVTIAQESAGSLESARKLTELGKIPDVIALADADVFPQYLMPEFVATYTLFARNRMVVAYTDRSRHADEMQTSTWTEILTRTDVEVGRSDPELDPNGYRTLMVWQLAERARNEPGLATRLEGRAVARNVRPKEADLVGLLEAGELDYIWSYESMAKAIGFRYVLLGDSVDLSAPALADFYRGASVSVRGAMTGSRVTFTGAPIVYAFAVPRNAPQPALAQRFAEFLVSTEGKAILRREGLDALDLPELITGTERSGMLAVR
ncbi:MAG: tungstate ABC transporter substrate-binding protein WtpA [Gemmatimonas sp.]|nr:tungstate ABC transporter substrate-binding protein WtpA [Gemmatimonas sp.]